MNERESNQEQETRTFSFTSQEIDLIRQGLGDVVVYTRDNLKSLEGDTHLDPSVKEAKKKEAEDKIALIDKLSDKLK